MKRSKRENKRRRSKRAEPQHSASLPASWLRKQCEQLPRSKDIPALTKPDEPYPQTAGQNKRLLLRLPLSGMLLQQWGKQLMHSPCSYRSHKPTKERRGAGEMAHCVRTLAAKQEDLNSKPQHLSKSQAWPRIPRTPELEDKEGRLLRASLVEVSCLKFSERLHLLWLLHVHAWAQTSCGHTTPTERQRNRGRA